MDNRLRNCENCFRMNELPDYIPVETEDSLQYQQCSCT